MKDKWKRSVQKVFTEECGFKAERVAKMSERFWGMNNSFSKWAKQCRKWSGADCPSHGSRIKFESDIWVFTNIIRLFFMEVLKENRSVAIAKQSRKKVKPAVNRSHENDRLVPSDLDSVNMNKMMSSGLGGWSFLLYLISSKFLKSSKIPESEPKMPRKRSTKKYFARTFPATRWCNIICLIKSKNMSLLKFNDFFYFIVGKILLKLF